MTGVERGWRQATWAGLTVVLVLLARWVVLAPFLGGDPSDPLGRTLLAGCDYLSAIVIAVGIPTALAGVAVAIHGRYAGSDARRPRWATRPTALVLAVLAASAAATMLWSAVLRPLLAGSRAGVAFVDRVTYASVVVDVLAVLGLGVAGIVAMSRRQRQG